MAFMKGRTFRYVALAMVWLGAIYLTSRLAYHTLHVVAFGWDTLLWSESPFMTNLLKIDRGVPVYGPPGDANSYVYIAVGRNT